MKVIPIYGKFYISGKKNSNSKWHFLCIKKTLNRAIRYADKYNKKGWYDIHIIDDESNNIIYTTRYIHFYTGV